MILAAGLGTRLRPLTDNQPKALVEVAGHTLLDIALSRMRDVGIHDVIINVHHFADMVAAYLEKNSNFGMNIAISREDILLDTGGGLKKAAWFFQNSSEDDPFLLHNVDVISNIDLPRVIRFHHEQGALATLAVQDRQSSRRLLFDQDLQLCGRRKGPNDPDELAIPCAAPHRLAFCGIHVISPRMLRMMTEDGVFSIIASYLRLAAHGERILAFGAEGYYWRDLGRPENIAQAEADAAHHLIRL
jgi:mannose-1-phosphate guanylyltransferase